MWEGEVGGHLGNHVLEGVHQGDKGLEKWHRRHEWGRRWLVVPYGVEVMEAGMDVLEGSRCECYRQKGRYCW